MIFFCCIDDSTENVSKLHANLYGAITRECKIIGGCLYHGCLNTMKAAFWWRIASFKKVPLSILFSSQRGNEFSRQALSFRFMIDCIIAPKYGSIITNFLLRAFKYTIWETLEHFLIHPLVIPNGQLFRYKVFIRFSSS